MAKKIKKSKAFTKKSKKTSRKREKIKLPKRRKIKKIKPRKKIFKRPKRKPIRKRFKKITGRKKTRRKTAIRKRIIRRKKIVKRKRARRKVGKSKLSKPRIYIGKGVLEQLFESQPKVKILKFFFRNSRGVFQPKEIFRKLRSNVSVLRKELNKLENIGIVKQKKTWLAFERKRGGIRKEKKIVYYLNPAFDFVNELRNLILKSTVASKQDLVNGVRKLGNIKIFLLSGVFTGDETAKADLLIVGDKINHRKLTNFIKDLEAEVGKELNCAIMTTKEFNYRYDMYDRFVRDLLSNKSQILINRVNLW